MAVDAGKEVALAELVQGPDTLFAGAANVETWFERSSNPGPGFFGRLAKYRHPMESLTLSTLMFWTHLCWSFVGCRCLWNAGLFVLASEFFCCSWLLRSCCQRRDCRHALKAATSHLLRLPLPQQEARGTPQRQCVMALPQQLAGRKAQFSPIFHQVRRGRRHPCRPEAGINTP